MDEQTRTELEAAAFRTLIGHFQKRTDVQNIDLMNMSGFCRNCLSKWMVAAGKERGVDLSMADARAHVYGMPYDDWKANHQAEASAEQQAHFKAVMGDPNLTTDG